MKRFIRTENGILIDTLTYGVSTWNNIYYQISIKKHKKDYFIETWEYDKVTSKIKLNIIKASNKIEEIVDKIVGNLAYIGNKIVAKRTYTWEVAFDEKTQTNFNR